MAEVDSDRVPELMIFNDSVKLGDRTLLISAQGNGRDIDAAFAAYEKLGSAMGKHVPNETLLVGNPDR